MTTINSNDNNNSNINISKNSNFKTNDIELKVIGESNNEPMGEKIQEIKYENINYKVKK